MEDRCLIGLPASIAADQDTKAGGIGHRHGPRRVRDELIAILINVDEGAESTIADFVFGARVDKRTLAPRQWRFLLVILEQILPDAREIGSASGRERGLQYV